MTCHHGRQITLCKVPRESRECVGGGGVGGWVEGLVLEQQVVPNYELKYTLVPW